MPGAHWHLAETVRFWPDTDRVSSKRRRTRHQRLSEAETRAQLVEPEPVQGGELTVEPATPAPSGTWVSGLVKREDGAMVQPLMPYVPQFRPD